MWSSAGKLLQHRRRLEGLGLPSRLYYVLNTLYGDSFRRRAIGTLGLRVVEISLTDRCQCRCVHCAVADPDSQGAHGEMTTGVVFDLLNQMSEMRATEVCFEGGEPLLRRDIVELVKYARRLGLVPKINTNGILLTEPLVLRLKSAGLLWCAVSIDSSRPETHDALRGVPGCFDKAVDGLRRLVHHQVPASISTYVRREALRNGDLTGVVQLGHDLGVDTVRVLFPVPQGRYERAQEAVLRRSERDEVRQLLADPIVTMEYPRENSRCIGAIGKLNITTSGDVTPCIFSELPFGNVHESRLPEIWRAMDEFARMKKPTGQCPSCDPEYRKKLALIAGRMSDVGRAKVD